MNLEEHAKQHADAGLAIMRGEKAQDIGPQKRSEDLQVALRHMLCAWVCVEATVEQLEQVIAQHKTSGKN